MARKEISGLIKRGGIWHVNKRFRGQRIRESTGTSDLAEAERYLIHRLEQIRQAKIYGVRRKRTFRQAAIRYLNEATKASIKDDARQLKKLDVHIGHLPLEAVHMGTLRPFISARTSQKVKQRTINHGLQVVRRILNLAAGEWLDEHGLTWLAAAPKIKMLPENDRRKPYPLSWDEQMRLFKELPPHLARMALFKVNSGCREQEVCGLKWEWENRFPELDLSVFVIPGEHVKNREPRVVILNRLSRAVIEQVRGIHPEYVFTYGGKRLKKMNGTSWRDARDRARLPQVRVHDLKHTFGRRLRAAGVSFEDRQDLLGHKSGKITTHYSQPEIENLVIAANKVCAPDGHNVATMVILREKGSRLEVA